jgi:asparagine synthetase B (glutamine-hydrolysing)
LTKIDRMAAAHGVSVAFPYLDDQLSDYVVALSPHTKFGIRSKPLLRLAMKGLVPGLIRQRTRRDFRVPQSGRVYQTIERVARQTVTAERADAIGLFNWQAVEEILRCASHNIYRRRQFWALLMFFAWYREMMES